MNKKLKEQIWKESKSAKDYPKDWLVIPAKDVIEIIENDEPKCKNCGLPKEHHFGRSYNPCTYLEFDSGREQKTASTVFTENNNQQESNGGRSLTSNNTSSPADTSYFNEETN